MSQMYLCGGHPLYEPFVQAALDSASEASAQVHLQRENANSTLQKRSDPAPASRSETLPTRAQQSQQDCSQNVKHIDDVLNLQKLERSCAI